MHISNQIQAPCNATTPTSKHSQNNCLPLLLLNCLFFIWRKQKNPLYIKEVDRESNLVLS